MALKRQHPDTATDGDIPSKAQPPAEEMEEKEWTIMDTFLGDSSFPDAHMFQNYMLITSTPEHTLATAPEPIHPTASTATPEPAPEPAPDATATPAPEPTKPPMRDPCGPTCR
ncbi:hypothetical protein SKAU_G00093920 [Synaphobranchus kaupii]|uniref:Uncharacterized protein n=1 Tax=Synaphobranchus kaupii TaxID=118154 RepID=A0A9Q1J6G2_SYNKA|nr:hypothetical protein SKAU_G00093920 [Synaphobranchus kaupii]